ncbi:hypothetical protein R1A27_18145 [Methylobacterium sp. NMS12]|uniref:hypothetical protein n=1 Tax=Methylobacterium sp. NMS12 TaxID=3079766 RepID=UPI003F880A81
MRQEMLARLNTLEKAIIKLEIRVDELLHEVEVAPDETSTSTMRALARGHRLQVLEMQSQFAVLKQKYAGRYRCGA